MDKFQFGIWWIIFLSGGYKLNFAFRNFNHCPPELRLFQEVWEVSIRLCSTFRPKLAFYDVAPKMAVKYTSLTILPATLLKTFIKITFRLWELHNNTNTYVQITYFNIFVMTSRVIRTSCSQELTGIYNFFILSR